MAKFEVGQRVNVNGNPYWLGEGIVRALYRGSVSVGMLTGPMSGEIGAFGLGDLEPIIDFQPGDIVRAEKGDEIIQAKVYEISSVNKRQYLYGEYVVDTFLEELEKDGYNLTLVKRPEPEIVLPTKPGMYFATEDKYERGDEWHSDGKIFYYLNTDGIWIDLGWGQPSVIDGELKVYKNE